MWRDVTDSTRTYHSFFQEVFPGAYRVVLSEDKGTITLWFYDITPYRSQYKMAIVPVANYWNLPSSPSQVSFHSHRMRREVQRTDQIPWWARWTFTYKQLLESVLSLSEPYKATFCCSCWSINTGLVCKTDVAVRILQSYWLSYKFWDERKQHILCSSYVQQLLEPEQ